MFHAHVRQKYSNKILRQHFNICPKADSSLDPFSNKLLPITFYGQKVKIIILFFNSTLLASFENFFSFHLNLSREIFKKCGD